LGEHTGAGLGIFPFSDLRLHPEQRGVALEPVEQFPTDFAMRQMPDDPIGQSRFEVIAGKQRQFLGPRTRPHDRFSRASRK
jgi:hypothetical protein